MTVSSHLYALHRLIDAVGGKKDVPLSPYSTLKVGGFARYFVQPTSVKEVSDIERAAFEHGIPLHILSGGSNTLFSDHGFDGIVMKLGSAFDYVHESKDGLSMRVGAATSYAKVTKMAVIKGWASAVGWSGIPGLMGGAVRMNAGTRFGEIGDAVSLVQGVINGKAVVLHRQEIVFGYRKNNLPNNIIITDVELSYDKNSLKPAPELLQKVQDYREKRRKTQPTINSLGSFFKNPYPSFAGELIEKCNLKGLQYKSAQISPLHANFIVNNGGASARDILYIAGIAQKTVFEQYGIMLCPEIKLVGTFDDSVGLCTEASAFNPNVSQE